MTENGCYVIYAHEAVAFITINRLEAMNALDFAANDELIEAWKRVRDDAVRPQPQGRVREGRVQHLAAQALQPGPRSDHPDFTQELPRKLPPTRAQEAQSHLREKR